jgi:single stranded DNA-binding protein
MKGVPMNKIILIGYTGGEPEIRLTKTAAPACSFRVASNVQYAGKTIHTNWFTVVTYHKTALYCLKRASKGARVYIEGTFRLESYLDKSGNAMSDCKIYPQQISFLDANDAPCEEISLTITADDDMPIEQI